MLPWRRPDGAATLRSASHIADSMAARSPVAPFSASPSWRSGSDTHRSSCSSPKGHPSTAGLEQHRKGVAVAASTTTSGCSMATRLPGRPEIADSSMKWRSPDRSWSIGYGKNRPKGCDALQLTELGHRPVPRLASISFPHSFSARSILSGGRPSDPSTAMDCRCGVRPTRAPPRAGRIAIGQCGADIVVELARR